MPNEKKSAAEYHREMLDLMIHAVADLGLEKAMKIIRSIVSTFKV